MSEQEKINDIRYSVEDIVGNFADSHYDRQAIVDNLLNDIVEDVSVKASLYESWDSLCESFEIETWY